MTIAEAFAQGLVPDRIAWETGYAAARAGIPWSCPPGADLLAYSLGHAAGVAECACRCAERVHPIPERRQ